MNNPGSTLISDWVTIAGKQILIKLVLNIQSVTFAVLHSFFILL